MKKLLILSALLLSGCYQVANLHDIRRAEIVCEGMENIVEIHVDAFGGENVRCSNKKGYQRLEGVLY